MPQFKTLITLVCPVLLLFLIQTPAFGQTPGNIEPDIRGVDSPRSPIDYGVKNGATFNLMVTNYGFGVGGQYRRVLGPMTEGVLELNISSVKDSREQAFFSIWGQQIIPNKYNRVLTFPLMAGMRQRVLADYIEDNFRIYLQGMVGPALTFVYPYFDDIAFTPENFPNAEGHDGQPLGVRVRDAQIYDVFGGWGDGEFMLGYAGKASLSIDVGRSFRSLTSIEFGVNVLYYPDGIQIMEPNRLLVEGNTIVGREIGEGFDAESWYLTPTITLMFGGMW